MHNVEEAMTTEESGFLIEEEERRKGHKTIKQFHCSDSTDLRRLQLASQGCTQNRAILNVRKSDGIWTWDMCSKHEEFAHTAGVKGCLNPAYSYKVISRNLRTDIYAFSEITSWGRRWA